MASATRPGKNNEVIAKEMIDQLVLLSQAMDEYFEMPSMTMRDADAAGFEMAAAPYENKGVAEKPGIDYRSFRSDKIFR